MAFPALMWILLVVAVVLSAVGFYKFVYFLSVGYGLAVAGEGIAIAIIAFVTNSFTLPLLIACVLFVVYGARLSGFLLIREIKSAAYRKTLNSQTEKPVPFFVKVAIWLCVAVLYVAQVSPVFYQTTLEGVSLYGNVMNWVGVAVMLIGIILESVADKQKSASKKINPHMVATTGLYKMCRCPNYFGEITFWTGVFLSAVLTMTGWQWVIAAFGYVCIVYIMFNGAQRLEKRQNKSYGDNPEYVEYAKKTPIIIPFLPIYTLVKKEK